MRRIVTATTMFGLVLALFSLATTVCQAGNPGEATYKSRCQACHGPDGKGDTAMGKANKLRDLASPDVQKQTDDELTAIINKGKNKMPGYGKSLKPEQGKELVAYLRLTSKK